MLTPVCVFIPERSAEVLRELCNTGATNYVIGRRLYMSEDTVKTHIKRITRRLPSEYSNRTALVAGVLRGVIVVRVEASSVSRFARLKAEKEQREAMI